MYVHYTYMYIVHVHVVRALDILIMTTMTWQPTQMTQLACSLYMYIHVPVHVHVGGF